MAPGPLRNHSSGDDGPHVLISITLSTILILLIATTANVLCQTRLLSTWRTDRQTGRMASASASQVNFFSRYPFPFLEMSLLLPCPVSLTASYSIIFQSTLILFYLLFSFSKSLFTVFRLLEDMSSSPTLRQLI